MHVLFIIVDKKSLLKDVENNIIQLLLCLQISKDNLPRQNRVLWVPCAYLSVYNIFCHQRNLYFSDTIAFSPSLELLSHLSMGSKETEKLNDSEFHVDFINPILMHNCNFRNRQNTQNNYFAFRATFIHMCKIIVLKKCCVLENGRKPTAGQKAQHV